MICFGRIIWLETLFLITLQNNCLFRATELSGARLKYTLASLGLDTLPLTRRVSESIFKSHYLVGEDTKPSGDFKTRGIHVPSLKGPAESLVKGTHRWQSTQNMSPYTKENLWGFQKSQEEVTWGFLGRRRCKKVVPVSSLNNPVSASDLKNSCEFL